MKEECVKLWRSISRRFPDVEGELERSLRLSVDMEGLPSQGIVECFCFTSSRYLLWSSFDWEEDSKGYPHNKIHHDFAQFFVYEHTTGRFAKFDAFDVSYISRGIFLVNSDFQGREKLCLQIRRRSIFFKIWVSILDHSVSLYLSFLLISFASSIASKCSYK